MASVQCGHSVFELDAYETPKRYKEGTEYMGVKLRSGLVARSHQCIIHTLGMDEIIQENM